ncbi:hypothetical protein [Bosea vaviloviae]|uniref:Transcriptional regulator n=1 Tax=Bosea vaviloviae TaxID=1526658 RepID=A0A0N1FHT0_9HYPH|nr:hypothetical protein [Bosea vaviloviae]KPH80548.1 hypothetical protein AE618_12300 [Bosea vaviloviae]
MKRGPASGRAATFTDPLAKAIAAWGEDMPREVRALAEACRATSGKAVAERVGYSGGVVSHMLARKYPGDIEAVFIRIRGALLGEEVECPVLGAIAKNDCLDHQRKPFSAANPARARLFRACSSCPHNRKKESA